MDWTSIASAIASNGAPILGGALGGPAGAAVGGIVGNLISGALGVAPTPEAVAGAIAADPVAAAAKIAPVDQQHGPAVARTASELELRLQDVQNARATQLAYVQAGSPVQWAPGIVSVVVCVAFAALCIALSVRAIPESGVATMIYGSLATAFGTVINFWLGSSSGSREKDATLNASVANTASAIGKSIAAAVRK